VLSSAAAPTLLIGGWTVAARLQDGEFNSVTGTISALAADDAQHRWVMTAALAGVGAAHVTTALALRPAPPVARWLIATGGVTAALVAANPLPTEGGHAPRHAVAAGVCFVSLGVWPAFSWRRRRASAVAAAPGRATATGPEPASTFTPAPVPLPFRPAVALAASGVLVAGLGWFFAELVKDGDRVGLSERVAAGTQAVWPLLAVLAARRRAR
jgi:hypothetical protein